jgi:hypothetical protein
MGVSEFWRYDGQVWRIYQLQDSKYQEVETSSTFPFVSKTKLYEFLSQAQQDEVEAEVSFRAWVRQHMLT